MAEVYKMLDDYKQFVTANNYFSEKRKSQQFDLFLNTIDEQLRQRFYADGNISKKIEAVKMDSSAGNIQPFALAKRILDGFFK